MSKNNETRTKPEIVELGNLTNVGDLKAILEKYPNDTFIGFRNQPMQCLFELKYQDGFTFLVFDK